MMHWWLKKGVDGFRMDVINMISKAPGLPDAPVRCRDRYQYAGMYFINGPRLLEFLGEMKREVLRPLRPDHGGRDARGDHPACHRPDQRRNRLPQYGLPVRAHGHRRGSQGRLAAPQRGALEAGRPETADVALADGPGRQGLEQQLPQQPRPAAPGLALWKRRRYRVESAKLLATFLHLLQGTPYIYQGEEIGMTNVAFETVDEYNDIQTINMYHELVDEKGKDPRAVMAIIHAKSRDNARTPVQWSAGPQAGFTTGTPWLKVNPSYSEINVEQALADPDSVFYLLSEADPAAQRAPGHRVRAVRAAPRRASANLLLYPHPGERPAAGDFELQSRSPGV